MIRLSDFPNTYFAVYGPDHDRAGQMIDRTATCACGATFTQMLLAPRELAAAERMGVIRNVQRQIPEFYVPVHCPPCERRDLSRQALIDDARARSAGTVPDRRRDWA